MEAANTFETSLPVFQKTLVPCLTTRHTEHSGHEVSTLLLLVFPLNSMQFVTRTTATKLDRAATFIRGRDGTEGLAEWATLTVGQAATRRHIVVGADIFFEK